MKELPQWYSTHHEKFRLKSVGYFAVSPDTPSERQTRHSTPTYRAVHRRAENSSPIMQLLQLPQRLPDSIGIKNSRARKQLLQQQQLTLQCYIDICKSSKASNTQIKSLGQSVKEEVHRVRENNKRVRRKPSANAKDQKQWKRRPEIIRQDSQSCKFSGRTHRFGR